MAKRKKAHAAQLAALASVRGAARERVIAQSGLHAWRPSAQRFDDPRRAANKTATRRGKAARRLYGNEV
jgi:hypothetical protein